MGTGMNTTTLGTTHWQQHYRSRKNFWLETTTYVSQCRVHKCWMVL